MKSVANDCPKRAAGSGFEDGNRLPPQSVVEIEQLPGKEAAAMLLPKTARGPVG